MRAFGNYHPLVLMAYFLSVLLVSMFVQNPVLQLSALLGVNPNTVQKAFHLLEEAGLICSRTGAKSCMTLDEAALARLRRELLTQDMRAVTRALRQAGVAREEALALLAGFWEEDSE